MFSSLSEKEWLLLRDTLRRRAPALWSLIRDRDSATASSVDLFEMCNTLSDEFCSSGLDQDDEPNLRGLEIEGLIGKILSIKYRNYPE